MTIFDLLTLGMILILILFGVGLGIVISIIALYFGDKYGL